MTDEGKEDTEKWVAAHHAEYAYAYDKGGKLARFFGVRGIPYSVLVDAEGTVVWKGSPTRLNDEIVKTAIQGALGKPLWEWSEDAKGVRKALVSGKYAKAREAAVKMDSESETYVGIVDEMAAGLLANIELAKEVGHWYRVETKGKKYTKLLKGLEQGSAIDAILAELKKDKAAQAVIKGQKKIEKLMAGKIKRKEIPKLKEQLRKIAADHPGTYVEKQVDAAIEKLTNL